MNVMFWQNLNPAGRRASLVLHPVVSLEASLANYTFLPYACFSPTTLQYTHTHTHTHTQTHHSHYGWCVCVFLKKAPRVMKNVKSLHRIKVNPDWRAKQNQTLKGLRQNLNLFNNKNVSDCNFIRMMKASSSTVLLVSHEDVPTQSEIIWSDLIRLSPGAGVMSDSDTPTCQPVSQ